MKRRWWVCLGVLMALAAPLFATPGKAFDPLSLVVKLAAMGPRPAGPGRAHRMAREILLAEMKAIGLSGVSEERSWDSQHHLELYNLTGLVPGRGEGEIVLSAHYDSVSAGPGADDDASGCAAVLGAAQQLLAAHLRHDVRVVLFDGEEEGMLGSRAWLASRDRRQRQRILADLNVEMVGWRGSAGPVVVSFPRRHGVHTWGPAWLVREALASADSLGWRLSFLDPRWSLEAQLVLHGSRVAFGTDNDRFVDQGVPAVFFSDSSASSFDPHYHSASDLPSSLEDAGMRRWSTLLAAVATRIDRLPERPFWRQSYLVIDGRIVGTGWLVALALLSFLPLGARLAASLGRGPWRMGELLAVLFVMLSLPSLALAPILAPWLLAPPAVALALARGGRWARRWFALAAVAPIALLWLGVLISTVMHLAVGWGIPLLTTLILTSAIACAVYSISDVRWHDGRRAGMARSS